MLKTVPDTPESRRQELDMQTTLGPALMATRGFAALEVEHAYARARQLCLQMGNAPQLFPVLYGLYRFYLIRAQLQTAREPGDQLLTVAQSQHDPALLLPAHRALGDTLFVLGEVAAARLHLEQGMALYDPQQHRSLAFLYGDDPTVDCLSFRALALWWLGYPDHALQSVQEALTLARELSHPFSLARALIYTAWLHQLRRESPAAQEGIEALMTLATEQGFATWVGWGTILQGWVLASQGQEEKGIAQMRQGLTAFQATGAELTRPFVLTLLAEAYGRVDQIEEGLSVLSEALAVMDNTGERFYAAEMYRLKGELLLKCGGQGLESGVSTPHSALRTPQLEEAEACFRQALDIAHRQQARSLELRAAMNLSRLWQRQGMREAARQLLAEAYGWFTEGFDTADLQEARALLRELGGEVTGERM